VVYDVFGKEVFAFKDRSRIDLTDFANGVYTIAISLDDKKSVYKKVVVSK
jgi:hypothetical protein